MVRPKEKEKNILEILQEQSRDYNERYPVRDTRWYVVEHTPARRYHDGYDYTFSNASNKVVSPYFKTKEAAEEWETHHVADEGKELRIKRQHLRRIWYDRWGV